MSLEKAISQVQFDIGQIDHLLQSYGPLLKICTHREPNLTELTAAASVLHSFYNGLEKMFLSIARNIDDRVPEGAHWHRDLLVQMSEKNEKRPAVISVNLKNRLIEYLAFRHYYRHAYSFSLEWTELSKLILPLLSDWDITQKELRLLLSFLEDQ